MMRNLLFVVLAALVFPTGILALDDDPYSLEAWARALRGNVAQVSEYAGKNLDALVLKRVILFGDKNRPSSESSYNEKGTHRNQAFFLYDAGGRIVAIHGVDEEGASTWKYTYDYDQAKRLLQESSFDEHGSLEWRDHYLYDTRGLLRERIRTGAAGAVISRDTYQYDEKHHLHQRETLYANGKLLKRVVIIYTSDGRVARQESFDERGLYEQTEYRYPESGHLVETTTTNADGEPKSRTERSYDALGRLYRERELGPDLETASVVTYQYDDLGNWTRRLEDNGSVVVRVIAYRK